MAPVEGLIYQGHSSCAAAAEDDTVDGDAVWVLPIRVDGGALGGWGGEAGVGVSSGAAARNLLSAGGF